MYARVKVGHRMSTVIISKLIYLQGRSCKIWSTSRLRTIYFGEKPVIVRFGFAEKPLKIKILFGIKNKNRFLF
jgi:hypothetical protein